MEDVIIVIVSLGISMFFFGFVVWAIMKQQKLQKRIHIEEEGEENNPWEYKEEPQPAAQHHRQAQPFLKGEDGKRNEMHTSHPEKAPEEAEESISLDLTNMDEVQKGIIYSEILKPKF